MSADLQTQLTEYGRYHRAAQRPIDPAELLSAGDPPASLQLAPAPRPPSRRRRWAWAAVAALAIGVLVGGIALLRQAPEDEVIEQTTTTVFVPTPSGDGGAIEPGSWSIAAGFVEPTPAAQVADRAAEVRMWPGVVEVAAVGDPAEWLELAGLDAADCAADTGVPPCGTGLVALVAASQIPLTSVRLETQFAMSAITASDVPGAFIEGYLAAAEAQTGSTDLQFDPASLGTEQPLSGPLSAVPGEECDECEIVVQTELEGFVFVTGLDIDGDPQVDLIHEVSGGGGTGIKPAQLSIDSTGQGGAIANLQAQVGGRAVYGFAFLPLDSAVVTFELSDGSDVWQRPIAGMALFVDGPGTAATDGDGGARATRLFTVLNASGAEIMHIRGTDQGPEIRDLRINASLAGATQTGVEDVVPAAEVAGMTLTWTQAQWPNIQLEAASSSGFLGLGVEGGVWRSTDGSTWQSVDELAGLREISLADAGTHLLLSGQQGDGSLVLLQSTDGAEWIPIVGAAEIGTDLDVVSATPSGLMWLRGRRDGGQIVQIDGTRIVESHVPPWEPTGCCVLVDLVEFDTGVVAFVTNFNEPRGSAAYRYEGAGEWSVGRSVPISDRHATLGNAVLIFDHTNATCCGRPIPGVSEWPLLESRDGLEWIEIERRESEDVHSLKITAGDSFWLYGPDIGGGGSNIETDPSRLLWISPDGREWVPIDISFAAPGYAVALGDSLFLRDGTGTAWIGKLTLK